MSKSTWTIIGIIVVIVVAVGGYAIFHKSSKTSTTSSYGASSTPAASSSGKAATSTTVNNAVVTTKSNSTLGNYLVDPSGNALYTYGADSSGVSNCTGSCLSTWPAYQDTGSTTGLPANISTLKRADNSQIQYTYKGMPLYTFVSDSKGQVTGNGVANFQVAKP